MQTKKAGQHWVKRGFAPEEVCPCLEARCPFPCKAAEPGDKGNTPDMAVEHYGYNEEPTTSNTAEREVNTVVLINFTPYLHHQTSNYAIPNSGFVCNHPPAKLKFLRYCQVAVNR